MLTSESALSLFRAALEEDRATDDVTTQWLGRALQKRGKRLPSSRRFQIVAKEVGVFAGGLWVDAGARLGGFEVRSRVGDGARLDPGAVVVEGLGDVGPLLATERVLLNGLQHACGIATMTRRHVDEVEAAARARGLAKAPGVYHTRKTLPLLRDLERSAVLAGGGAAHRRDLAEFVLFKDNHKEILLEEGLGWGDLAAAVSDRPVWIEVDTSEEAEAVVAAGFRRLLLDNFGPSQVENLLRRLPADCEIEISGGLGLGRLAPFVQPGVQRLSVGAVTHSARALDLSMDF